MIFSEFYVYLKTHYPWYYKINMVCTNALLLSLKNEIWKVSKLMSGTCILYTFNYDYDTICMYKNMIPKMIFWSGNFLWKNATSESSRGRVQSESSPIRVESRPNVIVKIVGDPRVGSGRKFPTRFPALGI